MTQPDFGLLQKVPRQGAWRGTLPGSIATTEL